MPGRKRPPTDLSQFHFEDQCCRHFDRPGWVINPFTPYGAPQYLCIVCARMVIKVNEAMIDAMRNAVVEIYREYQNETKQSTDKPDSDGTSATGGADQPIG